MDSSKRTISQREKVLLILVGVLAVAAAFYFFIYQRQIDEMASIRSKLSENNRTLEELRSFTNQLKTLERDVDALDVEIRDATMDWFPSLKQDVIIKDLDSKLSRTSLQDTSVQFVSSQVASIAKVDDVKSPRLADMLTLAFVSLMQDELEDSGEENKASLTETAEGLIEKASDALAVATPTPGPDNDEMTTAFGAQAGAGAGSGAQRSTHGELTGELQTKYDKLKSDLSGLTDAEMKAKLSEILGDDTQTSANVEKVVVNVSFKHSAYDSIIDFMKMIEASSPNIYVEGVEFSDHTNDYLTALQQELEYKEEKYTDEQNDLINKENERRRQAYEDEVYRVQLENSHIAEYNNNLRIESIEEHNRKVENKEVDELFDITDIQTRDYLTEPVAPEYLKKLDPRDIIKSYTGSDKYDGNITLSYFAISKIHRQ